MQDKIEELLIRYEELSHQLSDPEIIAQTELWQKLAKEYSSLEEAAAAGQEYLKLLKAYAHTKEMLSDPEYASLAQEELAELEEYRTQLESRLNMLLAPKDPDDDKNVVLEIRAGTGGEEAALFGMDLLRMYTRYCERKGWNISLMDISETDIGGVKEAQCLITGPGCFRYLKYESGAHRVQRVPVTESGGRIHTSAATVAVLPEIEDININIAPGDLKIETHRSSGSGGQHVNKTESAVRMVHLPTGIVVTCQDEKSQIKNREKAMRVMKARVADYYRSQAEKEYSDSRAKQVGSGDRSERIRTYNFPQGRVTDHRIGVTLYKLEAFLDGDMDELLEKLILAGASGELAEPGAGLEE